MAENGICVPPPDKRHCAVAVGRGTAPSAVDASWASPTGFCPQSMMARACGHTRGPGGVGGRDGFGAHLERSRAGQWATTSEGSWPLPNCISFGREGTGRADPHLGLIQPPCATGHVEGGARCWEDVLTIGCCRMRQRDPFWLCGAPPPGAMSRGKETHITRPDAAVDVAVLSRSRSAVDWSAASVHSQTRPAASHRSDATPYGTKTSMSRFSLGLAWHPQAGQKPRQNLENCSLIGSQSPSRCGPDQG